MALDNSSLTALGSLAGMGAGAAVGGPIGASVGGAAGGLLGSLFGGGGASKKALQALKQAQAAIAAIPSPTVEDMKLVLQPLVQQGILSPEQFQTISQSPSEFKNINLDPVGRNAEIQALTQLQDIANKGGMDAQAREASQEALDAANTNLAGQRGAILQNAQERGVGNSVLTTANQLAAANADAGIASRGTMQAASDAEKRALDAIIGSSQIGGQVSAQDYAQAANKAAALDAINRYNAQNTQNQSNLNTQTRNEAQAGNLNLAQGISNQNVANKNTAAQWNAALPQQVFQNNLSKAGAMAGVSVPIANMFQQGQQAQATTQGNLVGGLGTQLGNYYNNQALINANKASSPTPQPQQSQPWQGVPYYAHGGVVDGPEMAPGDSKRNDVVPAMLSAGEIVVPKSAAQNPISLADFIAHLPKPQVGVHPGDVKTVLKALMEMREGMYKGGIC